MEETKADVPLLSLAGNVKIVENMNMLSYSKCPVENYGEKMLRAMGWSEERGVGRSTKNAIQKPIEYVPRHHRLGLGATPTANMKIIGGAAQKNEHGKSSLGSHNVKYIGEKLKEEKKIELYSEVLIKGGRHKGMYGRVVGFKTDLVCLVELIANDQVVKVKKRKLELSDKLNQKRPEPEQEKAKKPLKKLQWVLPNLLVRIISKSYRNGKYYKIKGKVQDVLDEYHFLINTDKHEVLDDLLERNLETTIPPLAKNVMILTGEKRGEIGSLVFRDRKHNIVKVELLDDQKIVELSQDDVCDFIEDKQ